MIPRFSAANMSLLQRHLQALVEVEFFTIPFYLTGVYSFTNAALAYSSKTDTTPYMVQQKALSVAVQEMYHLQLAANLANAFKVTPDIPKMTLQAGTQIVIPHLEQNGQPLTAQLGNLPEAIQAMVDIETPDPNPNFPPPNEAVTYASISDLYHATLELLAGYLTANALVPMSADEQFSPGNNQVAYGTFPQTYVYNTITTRPDVADLANAVTDQGEGDLVASPQAGQNAAMQAAQAMLSGFFTFGDDGQVLPQFQPAKGSRFYAYGSITHFRRFEEIQATLAGNDWATTIGKPIFYPDGTPSTDYPSWAPADGSVVFAAINTIWSYLIDAMQVGFATGNLPSTDGTASNPGFNQAMLSFKYILPMAWQLGTAPSFVYRAGVTPADVQAAMDQVDPLCLFHWDARTAELRGQPNFVANACQGLNACQGMGWGAIATQAGNGACATADFHTCGGGNDCKSQGGCGYLSYAPGTTPQILPPSEQWIPDLNSCKNLGGCETPISTGQVFDRNAGATIDAQTEPEWTASAKEQLKALMGVNVWEHARTIFGEAKGISPMPAPVSEQIGDVNYDGTARRTAVQATST